MRYKAQVEYDGTGYYGFQRQRKGQPTIQAAVEKAITLITDQPVTITGAGRTDSGVHALGQVISFNLDWSHGAEALQRAINANLPADIAVLKIEETSPSFHPRYDAQSRAYEYHIHQTPVRSPLQRYRSWHINQSLDVEKMNRAAANLVGTHDFATFGRPPQGKNTVRQVFSANWRQEDDLIIFYIEANAFLYRMVRSLVGSLKVVGDGHWTIEEFIAAMRACDRKLARKVAPSHGLYLVSVTYGD